MESPSSWKIVKLVFLRKPDAEPKRGIRSCTAIALTSVMSKWYAPCIFLRLESKKELELPAPASDDDELTVKTLGMAGGTEFHVETRQCSKTDNVFGKLTAFDGMWHKSWTATIHTDG